MGKEKVSELCIQLYSIHFDLASNILTEKQREPGFNPEYRWIHNGMLAIINMTEVDKW